MADYSLGRDQNGQVRGLWLRDQAKARDPFLVAALLQQEGVALPETYRAVPEEAIERAKQELAAERFLCWLLRALLVAAAGVVCLSLYAMWWGAASEWPAFLRLALSILDLLVLVAVAAGLLRWR